MAGNEFDNKDECCPGGDCGCSNNSNSSKSRFWKLILTVIILLLAVAVTAYSLIYKTPDENSCCPSTGGVCTVPSDTLLTVENLNKRMGCLDLSLVIVTDQNAGFSEDLKNIVISRKAKIGEMDILTDTIIIRPSDPVYFSAVLQFELTELPAVIAMTEVNSAVLSGEKLTSNALAEACTLLLGELNKIEIVPENQF